MAHGSNHANNERPAISRKRSAGTQEIFAYAAVIGSVLLATVVRWLLDPVLGDRLPFITYFLAVLGTTYLGGFRHSMLVAALGLPLAWYFFLPDRGSFRFSSGSDIASLAFYVIVTGAIAAVGGRLRRSEYELAEFFENATVGLHWVGPTGIILRANRADFEFLGYSRDEYVGHNIAKFHADEEVAKDVLRRLREGENLKDYPARLRCKDGSIKQVLIDSSGLWERGRFVRSRCFTRDITRRSEGELAMRRLAAIVESSDDAIVSKDLNGIVTSWNQGAERVFGYTADEMIEQSIAILIPPDRVNEEPAILERISRGERVDHFETLRVRKDGTVIEVSLTISPIRDATGRIVGASKVARDITERARLHHERSRLLDSERAARAEAERAARLRDEFLATVSHELRTPLNVILGWAQLLRRSTKTPDVIEQGLDAIETGARSQAQLIEDLLDMNRIMSGKLHLDVQNVPLAAVVESALATLRPAIEAKEIRLQTTLATNVATIKGDPARLQQVVWNLVSNAVKFTPKHGKVQVLLERVNSHVELSVADNGMGINPGFLPHVFERFRQADSSASRQHGGLGLGLAIVKQIVELHGGSVTAESAGEGKGATFQVRLPVSIIKPPARFEPEYVRSAESEGVILAGVRVLVVDDDPGAAEIVKRMLEAGAAETVIATSGEEALAIIRATRPDIILSDIGMPGMDGYELIRELRKTGNSTPAIALTAFARPEDRIRSLEAGFTAHLSKPVDARELLIVTQAILRNAGRLVSHGTS